VAIVSIGVDVGQRVDPTAVVVAEPILRMLPPLPAKPGALYVPEPHREVAYMIRHLERLPLGTAYPAVGERLAEVVGNVQRLRRSLVYLIVDATGVGTPVIDILRTALANVTYQLVPVTFTHGDRLTKGPQGYSLGKAYLVSALQALLQTDRIGLPKTDEARALARELQDYEIRIDQDANDKYGAFKVGTHDDLVTALGLAVLVDRLRSESGTFDQ
jgi:hypothetical protein